MMATTSNLELSRAMDLSSLALGGLHAAEAEFNGASSEINQNSASSGSGDTADLSSSAVALLAAKENFAANLSAVEATDEIARQIINLMV